VKEEEDDKRDYDDSLPTPHRYAFFSFNSLCFDNKQFFTNEFLPSFLPSYITTANEQGCDEDIATDPFLYQWAPSPENDHPIRKIQHWIFYIPFSFMFALWRFDSIKVAISSVRQKRPGSKPGLYSLIAHYTVLLALFPYKVYIPAIFMSGLVSALIVTPTHQSEEMFSEYQSDWVTAQFQSTRNAVTTNPFSEWLWGGMQYQLEHHLFPSMPRSKYPKLRGILQKFAIEHNIPGGYRESGEFEILKMNWDLYRRVANEPCVEGAPSTRGFNGQQGGIIDSSNSPAATQIGALSGLAA
jgi:fatty acid desaturase